MKEVARIKRFSISELWYEFYVFETIEGVEYHNGTFSSLKDALEYVATFMK